MAMTGSSTRLIALPGRMHIAAPPDSAPSSWQVVLRSKQGVVVLYNRAERVLAVEAPARHRLASTVSASDDDGFTPVASSSAHALADDDLIVDELDEHEAGQVDDDGSGSPRAAAGPRCPLCGQRARSPPSAAAAATPSTSSSSSRFIRRPSILPARPSFASLLPAPTSPPPPLSESTRRARSQKPRRGELMSAEYFQILGESHQGTPNWTPEPSRPGTPVFAEIGSHLDASSFLDGYYARFFVELEQLGRGMTGSVFLCQHVLSGNHLGYFACKKIPVGNSSPSLAKALQEIKHLESFRHRNIVAIHHVWLETAQLSLGPPVPCLFALMDYANAGSLERYIRQRGGLRDAADDDPPSPDELKARARSRRSRAPQDTRAVHMFSLEEIQSFATDIASGLAYLHSRNMLHLDLKAENILLRRDDSEGAGDARIPTAMLSDFGSAEARNAMNNRQRRGTTGTLDYLAPEAFVLLPNGKPRPHSAQLDLWAMGLVFHLLAFFQLPYKNTDVDALTAEICSYTGFNRRTSIHHRRDLPAAFLDVLEALIDPLMHRRPSAQDVLRHLAAAFSQGVSVADVTDDRQRGLVVPGRSSSSELVVLRRPTVKPALPPASGLSPHSDPSATYQWRSLAHLAARTLLVCIIAHARAGEKVNTAMSLPLPTFTILCLMSLSEITTRCSDALSVLFTSVLVLISSLHPQALFLR